MTDAATVVFVADAPCVGGAERSLIRIAGALDDARYRPFVLSGHRAIAPALDAAGIPSQLVALPAPAPSWPGPFALSVARIGSQLRRHRAAVLHVNDAPAHLAASLAARMLRIPRLCHIHFTYPAAGLRWWLKWGFEHALFASQYAKAEAQQECPDLFAEERCSVIANGYEPPAHPLEDELGALRAACGLERDAVVIGFVGRLLEAKGVADFLHMARTLLDSAPRCRFLLVGDDHRPAPNYRTAMETLAERLGVAAACRFVGFRDDVWALLHLCDVVVMPSHVEPFGNVAVEAGAAGRAVVAADVGGLREIIGQDETGVLVPARDPRALAVAVGALLADPARRVRLGAAARARVAAQFTLAAQVDALMALYDELRRDMNP